VGCHLGQATLYELVPLLDLKSSGESAKSYTSDRPIANPREAILLHRRRGTGFDRPLRKFLKERFLARLKRVLVESVDQIV
jgi:hypothetical protein